MSSCGFRKIWKKLVIQQLHVAYIFDFFRHWIPHWRTTIECTINFVLSLLPREVSSGSSICSFRQNRISSLFTVKTKLKVKFIVKIDSLIIYQNKSSYIVAIRGRRSPALLHFYNCVQHSVQQSHSNVQSVWIWMKLMLKVDLWWELVSSIFRSAYSKYL